MKRNIKSVVLLAALSIAAAGCQKENIIEPNGQIQQNMSVRHIAFTIDGVTMHTTILGEQKWQSFLDQILALAKKGHRVKVANSDAPSCSTQTKEVVTYVTTSESDAKNWMDIMIKDGYEVIMEYDERTGKYICTAFR